MCLSIIYSMHDSILCVIFLLLTSLKPHQDLTPCNYVHMQVWFNFMNSNLIEFTKGFNITVSSYSFTLIGDASLTSNDKRPCPDDMIVFTCNVSGVDLFWQVFSNESIQVAQFNIDDRTMVNVPEGMLGFIATLRSRTPNTDSSSTLTTTASVQINGYTVVCTDAAMEIGRKTIQLSSEFM